MTTTFLLDLTFCLDHCSRGMTRSLVLDTANKAGVKGKGGEGVKEHALTPGRFTRTAMVTLKCCTFRALFEAK